MLKLKTYSYRGSVNLENLKQHLNNSQSSSKYYGNGMK